MGKVAVITDSNSGITQSQAKELGIFVLPMPFMIDEEPFFEDINLSSVPIAAAAGVMRPPFFR